MTDPDSSSGDRRTGYHLHLWYLALPLAILTGCSSGPDMTPGHGQPMDDVRLHVLMTDQISVLTDQLNTLMFEQHRTESELDALRGERSGQVATAARRLRQSALRISETPPAETGALDAPERFAALAGQLAEHAGELARLAQAEQVTRYQSVTSRINATCDACHGLYRDR